MKTTVSFEQILQFLMTYKSAVRESVRRMSEGYASQAVRFRDKTGRRMVMRLADKQHDFNADKYAYEHFGTFLPIPEILEIGCYGAETYFCISRYAAGRQSSRLEGRELSAILPVIWDSFAAVHGADISSTVGFGYFSLVTGHSQYGSMKEVLNQRLGECNAKTISNNAAAIGLDAGLAGKFVSQFERNIKFASETRRLTHGDIGQDNLLVLDGAVTAVIDWAGMGYGDWMADFAKLDFWTPGRYGSAEDYAKTFSLEAENLAGRRSLFFASIALSSIKFAAENNSPAIISWLQTHARSKLI